jgi:hypothetical protein
MARDENISLQLEEEANTLPDVILTEVLLCNHLPFQSCVLTNVIASTV